MASIILGSIGSTVGASLGGGLGGAIGQFAGTIAGKSIDQKLFSTSHTSSTQGFRLEDLHVQSSTYGRAIPIIYGTIKIAGNIIWATKIKEKPYTHTQTGGGKGAKITRHHTTYSYSVSIAIGICEGSINEVQRVWADNRLINLANYNARVYKGTEDQLPDPLIQSIEGMDNTPGYRGLAYIVFEDLPLSEFGNRLPNFTFEVNNYHTTRDSLESMVQAVTIIPGSGEFVYDTKLQHKAQGDLCGSHWVQRGQSQCINCHNHHAVPDSIISLNQLHNTLPNIKWAAPVATWFADSLDIDRCKIKPGVEYKGEAFTTPEEWQVEQYTRTNAHLINYEFERPRYGGTPHDQSIVRYLKELKSRNLNVMFYPMVFVDIDGKPWRGHMSGSAGRVKEFFNGKYGYNRFILHYAKLVRGFVDAFLIGSEFKNITKIKDEHGNFPAVDELIQLAKQVKQILGSDVKISYAADWSEYHHTDGGWFHLDPLWASSDIDFIGIDAYFPLTEGEIPTHHIESGVFRGWQSGEGYDYYYTDSSKQEKRALASQYAWKNIGRWWGNYHHNPDGSRTPWIPKSKKIWFTEYGFPSVDCASNQPNVFYSPNSQDSGFPIHSKGNIDFEAQRSAIKATERFWQNSEFVENKFLWTWDARPYPFWPDLKNVWCDSDSWSKGHWIQGKLGRSSLEAIIRNLCERSSIPLHNIDMTRLNIEAEGMCITQPTSFRKIIKQLSQAYAFYLVEKEHMLSFLPNYHTPKQKVDSRDIVLYNNQYISVKRAADRGLPYKVEVKYLSKEQGYSLSSESSSRSLGYSRNRKVIDIPLVLSKAQAAEISYNQLYEPWVGREVYTFYLPINYAHLKPGNVIEFSCHNVFIKVLEINLSENHTLQIIGHSAAPTHITPQKNTPAGRTIEVHEQPNLYHQILDIPFLPQEDPNKPRVLLAVCSKNSTWNGCDLYIKSRLIQHALHHNTQAVMGKVINVLPQHNPHLIDYRNYIKVNLFNGDPTTISEEELFNHSNLALVGNEIIQFQYARMLKPYQYELKGLIRGCLGTEKYITEHQAPERFVLLDMHTLACVENLQSQLQGAYCNEVTYMLTDAKSQVDEEKTFRYTPVVNCLKPRSPIIKSCFTMGEYLYISWIRKARITAIWKDFGDVPLSEEKELYYIAIKGGDNIIFSEYITQSECKINLRQLKLGSARKLHIELSQISSEVGLGATSYSSIRL